ncbi:nucleotidyltransferase family protein [Trichlorobacter lovleyi]|uniref:DNA polymerase beta domain protein region n=1 Tax=Trichlorobacter lovleyi (strain ATCC BAA-1151 / DSM 17278 / SZ) TaxID=398767 RepID=B3E333_TRIL1|nr:nucleotidyltransferase domain-containing protein [Trichlorobacter lovleyi]ACD97293.1 DNA polymerase beta domain protein region [Trichlorobacter lovleyi SZ]
MLDLTPDQLAEVRQILQLQIPERTVRVFGSRVNGTAKPFSDLDLVVMGDVPLDFRQLADLKDAFAESNLPFRVDVVDWATTSAEFRQIVERSWVLV